MVKILFVNLRSKVTELFTLFLSDCNLSYAGERADGTGSFWEEVIIDMMNQNWLDIGM